jgi:endonuclease YncB( thermonuclease family)
MLFLNALFTIMLTGWLTQVDFFMAQVQRRRIPLPAAIAVIGLLILICWMVDYFNPRQGPNRQGWAELTECEFLTNPANDGDSFHVQHGRDEYIVRLYYVDTPETTFRFFDRVREQAYYFGINEQEATALGREAKNVTAELLSKPFTVHTQWQDAMGSSRMPRYFAFVSTADGKDLGRELVRRGLARVHGFGSRHPQGQSRGEYKHALYSAQKRARQRQLGGWEEYRPD